MAEAYPEAAGPAVGIDLGTTFSCVSVFINGKPKVLPNEHGNRITPSCVAFTDISHVVGEDARFRLTLNPTRTIYQVKRLMGRTFDDPLVQEDIKRWSFDVVNDDGKPKIKVFTDNTLKLFSPEEISAKILVKMKEIAENELKMPVTQAVITVPAYFNDDQRQATKTAAKLAGLEVLRIINEPTAAAMAYGFSKNPEEQHLLMYDLGGGTFDVSVLLIDDGIIRVLATGGDTHLGGVDFDNIMIDRLVEHFTSRNPGLKEKVKTNVKEASWHRLARAVEFAKCQLSTEQVSKITIDAFHENEDALYDMYRDAFEEFNQHLFNKTIEHVGMVLEDASLKENQIDEVVLVGGSTRIPAIQQLLKDYFNGKKINKSINPDEAVACGAAIQAAILLGVSDVDPILLMDVTPLSLGVEKKGGLILNVLTRNSPIPATGHQEVTTVKDFQKQVDFVIFQGERPIARDNHYLGEFILDDIESAPAGVPTIDVKFDIDVDGILNVTAIDKTTRAKQSIRIDRNMSHLSEQDVAKLVEDAHTHKEEDQQEKKRIEAINKLQMLVSWVQYIINNQLDKLCISDHYRQDIVEKCREINEWQTENQQASTDEYRWQHDIICDVCKDLPPGYLTPGMLPGGSKVRNYMTPVDSLTSTLNDDQFSDDEVVNELD